MSTSTSHSGPYAAESRADAWLFEHSKFLRKHFSHKGPTDIPSKHELVQEHSSGNAFPRESKMDAALFEHSKFLRNHVKHDGNDDGIKSKHAMLRESFDGERPKAGGKVGAGNEGPIALRKTMRSNNSNTNDTFQDDPLVAPVAAAAATSTPGVANGTASPNDISHLVATEDTPNNPTPVPAWQAATDTSRAYGDEASLRSAAAAGLTKSHTGPGLISHHPTTMESSPVVSRPVPHSLMSNSVNARIGEEVSGDEGMVGENPMARVRRVQNMLRSWSSEGSRGTNDASASTRSQRSGKRVEGIGGRSGGSGSGSGSHSGAGIAKVGEGWI